MREKEQPCLMPLCGALRHTRGLCGAHYMMARSLVVNGKTTFEKLQRAGRILPKKHTGEREIAQKAWLLGDLKPINILKKAQDDRRNKYRKQYGQDPAW